MGEGVDCTYGYTATTRMSPAVRWAVMRAILIFVIVSDKAPQTTTFEERGQPKQNRIEAFLLTSLTPYG